MAKRRIALYKGNFIGIESIYTVGPNGEQINIPGKVEALRRLGKSKELFCPCGCGANLILVAGDAGLREQHFRIANGEEKENCELKNVADESITSVNSKIVLKMWLDVQLHDENLQTRVPIKDIHTTDRKYELSFYSSTNNLALSYIHERANIDMEKLTLLNRYRQGMKVFYIVDSSNSVTTGQYPENNYKIQRIQGCCLFLHIGEENLFNTASLKVSVYLKDIDEFWQRVDAVEGLLKDFSIHNNRMFYEGKEIFQYVDDAKKYFYQKQKQLEDKRKLQKQIEEEEQRRRLEQWKEIEKQREQREAQIAKEEQERLEYENERKREVEDFLNKKAREREESKKINDEILNKKYTCIYCGKVADQSEFASWGGDGMAGKGKCWECSKKIQSGELKVNNNYAGKTDKPKTNHDNDNICPLCREKLVIRNGRYGKFIGCSSYPKCKYTRTVTKYDI